MLKPGPTIGDTSWFIRDRFGMFIHWGLYASGARHEWLQNQEKIAPEAYAKYLHLFNPDLYDPQQWARQARAAGMKYMVVTSKHHEGFCLWDSQFTDFKATNCGAKRDLLASLVEAFRAEGLRVGLYYSLLDWHHPHFPIDNLHPLREHAQAHEMNQGRDVKIYAQYMRDQVRELIERFGPEILWFDFSYPGGGGGWKGKGREDWESQALMDMVRELAPRCIVNNRLDLPDVPADVHTPEQFQPREWVRVEGKPVVWEACQTFSGSWGYHRDESSWKSQGQLIRMLIDTVSKGGNLLMNVGPTARGEFDGRARSSLEAYARWMKQHERSIYNCTQSEFSAPSDVRYTQNFELKRLYVHVFAWPFVHLHLPGLADKVEYAQLLNDGSEVAMKMSEWAISQSGGEEAGTLSLELPVVAPDVAVPVIELFLK